MKPILLRNYLFGPTLTPKILLLLKSTNGKEILQSDIGRTLSTNVSHISKLLTYLEGEGLIERRNRDGRSKVVSLTSLGIDIASKIEHLYYFEVLFKNGNTKT